MAPRPDISRLLRARSVAIIGASDEPSSTGARVLANLERFNFAGEIHLVSRTRKEVSGRPCIASPAELPEGIDVAVLAVPRAAVVGVVEEIAARKVGAAVVYASGFAEGGERGLAEQAQITRIGREHGIALLGPNCIGFNNFVDGFSLSFGVQKPRPLLGRPAVAVVAQSGGMTGNIRLACEAKGLAVSFTISTGNEAVLGIEDFIGFLLEDTATRVIAVFAEQIRSPARFLTHAARAREIGKPIVLLHPGRSEGGRAAAQSHTGSMTNNYAVMRTVIGREGVVIVDTLEEMFDVVELLIRQPVLPTGGVAVLTDSGAFKGLSADFCDSIGLDLPPLSQATQQALIPLLPAYTKPTNPLDVTAQGLMDAGIYGNSARVLLADPAIGSLLISIMPGPPEVGLATARLTLPALTGSGKTIVYVLMGGDSAVSEEVVATLRAQNVPLLRSPERALRAIARVTEGGRATARARDRVPAPKIASAAVQCSGVLPEYEGKRLLAAAGFKTPDGAMAHSADEAVAVAGRIGYPVVLKAQSAQLPHKTEVGGVVLHIGDEAQLRAAWARLHASVSAARPDLQLDGVLVETMSSPGLEMVVAARRDPDWGPVLMLGVGGIWIEALQDIRLLPGDCTEHEIAQELQQLKAAKLLNGWRGAPAVDVTAIAQTAARLSAVLRAQPSLDEIEINPLLVYPAGEGAVALDVLAVASEARAHE
jgi:acyl-CoA synthetase (NDP forming)